MTYGTHLLGGAAAGAAFLAFFENDMESAAYVLSGAAIGSLLPDIDHTKSKISRSNTATSVLSHITALLSTHRGIIHTPLCLLILVVLLRKLTSLVPIGCIHAAASLTYGIAAGFLSHLLLDTLNPGGIMWAYPFSQKHLRIAQIKTRSLSELLTAGVLVLIDSLLFYNML